MGEWTRESGRIYLFYWHNPKISKEHLIDLTLSGVLSPWTPMIPVISGEDKKK